MSTSMDSSIDSSGECFSGGLFFYFFLLDVVVVAKPHHQVAGLRYVCRGLLRAGPLFFLVRCPAQPAVCVFFAWLV